MPRTRVLIALTALLALGAVAYPAQSMAGWANAGLPTASKTNPLAGMHWGAYYTPTTDPTNDAPSAYYNSTSNQADRATLARILAQPRFRWFGAWNPIYDQNGGHKPGARNVVRYFIDRVTGGNPNVGAQVAVFRLQPFERAACTRLPTLAEQQGFKDWVSEFAKGIGTTRTALVLQPDMPFTLCLPGASKLDMHLISWAARTFWQTLPYTTVYIDAGAADWGTPKRIAWMLYHSGVRYVRGFALNVTHYDSDGAQVRHGNAILYWLNKWGIRGKRFVINSSQNGAPFTPHSHPRIWRAGGPVCYRRNSVACTTLGRAPTTNTGSSTVDAYLWMGRPWLANTHVRSYAETLRLVRTSPFFP